MGVFLEKEDDNGELNGELEKDLETEIQEMLKKSTGLEEIELEFEAKEENLDKPIVTINYNLVSDEVDNAYHIFQKLVVRKRCIINTAIIAVVVGVIILEQLTSTHKSNLLWFLIAACAALVFAVWFNPYRLRKTIVNAMVPLADDRYTLTMFDEYITIETTIPENEDDDVDEEDRIKISPKIINFYEGNLRVIETDDIFILFIDPTDMMFVLPKRCMAMDEISILSQELEKILDDKFQLLTTKS